jgi:hypothetical protein
MGAHIISIPIIKEYNLLECYSNKEGSMSVIEVHARLANTAILYIVILAVWAFIRFFRGQGVSSSVWGSLVIGELVIIVQGGLGVYLWFLNLRPERDIHILYGIISAIVIPAVFGFTRGRDTRSEMLIYAASLLFLAGILTRAIGTG